ncbi:four-carbon acid sugar kinase family protein [Devosia rhizoryzae]|uniref:Four-carbon acid sugar kinase family protein n=1 Tax=Devosia rhizoryzae TaxID=2774137 RepID=A0ABX7C2J8_9HYPH|nr:four-carbon acid sugar kinase family protein [Devosia rhizoryzae]QQR38301.1 four-carbon acid sugar kinase family protein [Devosia rhizoryzae]
MLRIRSIALLVAIVADDLTGALDVSAPFARLGLKVQIAVSLAGLPYALQAGAEVVCVTTASRELPAGAAAQRMAEAASKLAEARPAIVFNKIDSRLKGHVRLGIQTCLKAFGRRDVVVAPGVPAQGRLVRNGLIVGSGVLAPIDIASRVDGIESLSIPDSATNEDMERIARRIDSSTTLFVGASGLGAGLARALTDGAAAPFLQPSAPMLFAIGSHDPVTHAQVDSLTALAGCDLVRTTDGAFASDLPWRRITLVRAMSQPDHPEHGSRLARFGRSIAEQLRRDRFESVLLCGGETAQTVLDDLGITTLLLRGEAASGIPLFEAQLRGRSLTILTKSGGFGTPDDLLRLAEVAHPVAPDISSKSAGIYQ